MQRTWIISKNIKSEHQNIPVTQIYLWLITNDNKIVIVGKNDKFQMPGGKPESNESQSQTLHRELFEETGINLEEFENKPEMFGYYLIENDYELKQSLVHDGVSNSVLIHHPNWPDHPKYLQLRYELFVDKSSNEIKLQINEPDSSDAIQEAKFVDLNSLPEFIPWMKDLEEYNILKNKYIG